MVQFSFAVDTIEDGEIVWVKYKRDPHWPALVSQIVPVAKSALFSGC